MQYLKSILSTILVVLIISFVESRDNYLYSIESNINPINGQHLTIFDMTTGVAIFNQTFLIQNQILSIVSVDRLFSKVVFLAQAQSDKILLEYNTKSGAFKTKASVNEQNFQYSEATQQSLFVDKVFYLPGRINQQSIPSILKWDFNKEQISEIQVELPYYDLNSINTIYPFLATDDDNVFYMSYQSNISSVQSSASFAVFDINEPAKKFKAHYGINGLNTNDIRGLFTDKQGNLWAIKSNENLYNSIDVCQINFQLSTCVSHLTVYLGGSQSIRYIPFFISHDKSKLITLTNIDDGWNQNMQIHAYDIGTWNSTVITLNNQWQLNSLYTYNYFAYI